MGWEGGGASNYTLFTLIYPMVISADEYYIYIFHFLNEILNWSYFSSKKGQYSNLRHEHESVMGRISRPGELYYEE